MEKRGSMSAQALTSLLEALGLSPIEESPESSLPSVLSADSSPSSSSSSSSPTGDVLSLYTSSEHDSIFPERRDTSASPPYSTIEETDYYCDDDHDHYFDLQADIWSDFEDDSSAEMHEIDPSCIQRPESSVLGNFEITHPGSSSTSTPTPPDCNRSSYSPPHSPAYSVSTLPSLTSSNRSSSSSTSSATSSSWVTAAAAAPSQSPPTYHQQYQQQRHSSARPTRTSSMSSLSSHLYHNYQLQLHHNHKHHLHHHPPAPPPTPLLQRRPNTSSGSPTSPPPTPYRFDSPLTPLTPQIQTPTTTLSSAAATGATGAAGSEDVISIKAAFNASIIVCRAYRSITLREMKLRLSEKFARQEDIHLPPSFSVVFVSSPTSSPSPSPSIAASPFVARGSGSGSWSRATSMLPTRHRPPPLSSSSFRAYTSHTSSVLASPSIPSPFNSSPSVSVSVSPPTSPTTANRKRRRVSFADRTEMKFIDSEEEWRQTVALHTSGEKITLRVLDTPTY